jgi:acetamidase/formamidase
MREVRVQIHLHEQRAWHWPFAETETHWIAIGVNRDLTEAFRIALRNTVDFLARRANLTRNGGRRYAWHDRTGPEPAASAMVRARLVSR